MTNNQISYYKAREEARHNLAAEEEMKANNLRIAHETNRHNMYVEGQSDRSISEVERANKANEEIKLRDLAINQQYKNQSIAETTRSNMAKEDLERLGVQIKQRQADTNQYVADTNRELGLLTYGVNIINADTQKKMAAANALSAQASMLKSESVSARTAVQNLADVFGLGPNLAYKRAQTSNLKAQTQTEESKRFVNYVRGATSLISPISMLVGGVK